MQPWQQIGELVKTRKLDTDHSSTQFVPPPTHTAAPHVHNAQYPLRTPSLHSHCSQLRSLNPTLLIHSYTLTPDSLFIFTDLLTAPLSPAAPDIRYTKGAALLASAHGRHHVVLDSHS